MNSVLKTTTFWRQYLTMEPGDATEGDFTAQLEELRRNFAIHQETFHYDYQGQRHTGLLRFADFSFHCGERFSLVIEWQPTVHECSRTLYLADAVSGTRSRMGWWDSARWHPYCLQLSELDLLLKFWERRDRRWNGPAVPFLLLCQFVGLPDTSARDALVAGAQFALQSLDLPVADTADGPIEIPLHVPEGGYRWEIDEEFGSVFTSDEYCCYSIRNRPHAGSDEGWFPFSAFREMMAEIQDDVGRG